MNINKEIFDTNLLLTQAYCELQLQKPIKNNAEILRTFNPEYGDASIFSFKKGTIFSNNVYSTVWQIDPLDFTFLYDEFFEKQLSNKQDVVTLLNHNDHYEGRILVAEIDSIICDGVSEYESDGIIDGNDCPPIDTWFYLLKGIGRSRYLFAWIPKQFVGLVNQGIDVNLLNIFNWYDDGNYFIDR